MLIFKVDDITKINHQQQTAASWNCLRFYTVLGMKSGSGMKGRQRAKCETYWMAKEWEWRVFYHACSSQKVKLYSHLLQKKKFEYELLDREHNMSKLKQLPILKPSYLIAFVCCTCLLFRHSHELIFNYDISSLSLL